MYYPTDPDEFCVNCGAKIQGIYRTCGFCGKVWWVKDDSETGENCRDTEKKEVI